MSTPSAGVIAACATVGFLFALFVLTRLVLALRRRLARRSRPEVPLPPVRPITLHFGSGRHSFLPPQHAYDSSYGRAKPQPHIYQYNVYDGPYAAATGSDLEDKFVPTDGNFALEEKVVADAPPLLSMPSLGASSLSAESEELGEVKAKHDEPPPLPAADSKSNLGLMATRTRTPAAEATVDVTPRPPSLRALERPASVADSEESVYTDTDTAANTKTAAFPSTPVGASNPASFPPSPPLQSVPFPPAPAAAGPSSEPSTSPNGSMPRAHTRARTRTSTNGGSASGSGLRRLSRAPSQAFSVASSSIPAPSLRTQRSAPTSVYSYSGAGSSGRCGAPHSRHSRIDIVLPAPLGPPPAPMRDEQETAFQLRPPRIQRPQQPPPTLELCLPGSSLMMASRFASGSRLSMCDPWLTASRENLGGLAQGDLRSSRRPSRHSMTSLNSRSSWIAALPPVPRLPSIYTLVNNTPAPTEPVENTRNPSQDPT